MERRPHFKLKGLRAAHSLNQTQMAEIAGCKLTAYNFKELYKSDFTISEIKRILDYFGLKFEEVFF